MTRELRKSPWWSSFREELLGRGLNPNAVVLVDGFDDDEDIEVGLLYTEAHRFIAWRREYSDDDPSKDRILTWDDITDRHETLWAETMSAYRQALAHTRTHPPE